MDDKHLTELVTWLENNIDVEAGLPVIFNDYAQVKLEELFKKGEQNENY